MERFLFLAGLFHPMPRFVNRVLFCIVLCSMIILLSCVEKKDKPLDLGLFTRVGDISISPDGDNILFTGIGLKDHPNRTIFRFQRSTGKLYRYAHSDPAIELEGGRFSPSSSRFAFMFSPRSSNPKEMYEQLQIGVANMDGSGFRQVTSGYGVKLFPVLTFDEKTLLYEKGRYRKSGGKGIVGLDIFKLDLQNGTETQITRLAFYGLSKAYVTADNRSVVFAGDSPTRWPDRDSDDSAEKLRNDYWDRYHEHIILKYALDGSDSKKLPVPIFHYDIDFGMTSYSENMQAQHAQAKDIWEEKSRKFKYGGPGSRSPMLTKDGTIWFEGRIGIMGWTDYYRRYPKGSIEKIDRIELSDDISLCAEWDITPDGMWLLALVQNRKTGLRSLRRREKRGRVFTLDNLRMFHRM